MLEALTMLAFATCYTRSSAFIALDTLGKVGNTIYVICHDWLHLQIALGIYFQDTSTYSNCIELE